jgi:hypothetical protein
MVSAALTSSVASTHASPPPRQSSRFHQVAMHDLRRLPLRPFSSRSTLRRHRPIGGDRRCSRPRLSGSSYLPDIGGIIQRSKRDQLLHGGSRRRLPADVGGGGSCQFASVPGPNAGS